MAEGHTQPAKMGPWGWWAEAPRKSCVLLLEKEMAGQQGQRRGPGQFCVLGFILIAPF